MSIQNNVDFLEKLLSFAIGKEKAKIDAEKICNAFPMPLDLTCTSAQVLQNISGCRENTAAFMRLLASISARRITDEFKAGKKYSKNEIERYICALLFTLTVESVYMISFDKNGRLLAADLITEGTVNSSAFLPRKMVDMALKRKAASVILAHNHPSGNPVPSDNDVSVTLLAESVLADSRVRLDAHYITVGFDFIDCFEYIRAEKSKEKISFSSVNPK